MKPRFLLFLSKMAKSLFSVGKRNMPRKETPFQDEVFKGSYSKPESLDTSGRKLTRPRCAPISNP